MESPSTSLNLVHDEDFSETMVDDGRESIFTDADTMVEVSAIEKLLNYFQENSDLVGLASELFKMDSEASSNKRFSDILLLYAEDLRMAATNDVEVKASKWVERKRHPITAAFYWTIKQPGTKGPLLMESSLSKEPHARNIILDRFLSRTDEPSSGTATQLPNSSAKGKESEEIGKGKDGGNDDEPLEDLTSPDEGIDPILDSMEDFMILSPAFSQLLGNLQKVVTSQSQNKGKVSIPKLSDAYKTYPAIRQVRGTWTCVSANVYSSWTLD